jgi:2-desacetyl-2-hydroxyethyl bacteriochlorophyllide A dehydrogenase
VKKLLITDPYKLGYEELPDEPLKPAEIRIRSILNGISHGTEMNFFRGTAPNLNHHIDGGLFQKRKVQNNPYPIWHGYETVGEVMETGSEVTEFNIGDIVWSGNCHADISVCDTTIKGRPFFLEHAPEGIDAGSGVFLALAGVAYDGLLTSNLRLGETGVVSGLGCTGLLSVQLLANAGIKPIFAIDPLLGRRRKALEFGADHVIDPVQGNVPEQIRDINSGKGVDAAIETSGNWKALHEAVRCCASNYGRVVAVGFYQGGGMDLRLGEEFHHSSFHPIGASSILAINHRGEPAEGRAWDRIRVYHTLVQMFGEGKIKTDGLITHKFKFEDAQEAFDLIDKHPEDVLKVVLTF